MAYTQTDLDRVKKAIASGVMTVEIEGRRITYRDMDDLIRAKAEIENELSASSGGTLRQTVVSYRRD